MVVSSDEHKRKSKSKIVCLWRTAMIVFVKCGISESKCFKRSYVFADCNGCGLLRTQGKIEKRYCMSLRTAMIVSCYEHKGKSKSNIVCLCRLQ